MPGPRLLSIVLVANGHVEDVLNRRELRVASVVERDLVRWKPSLRERLMNSSQ